MSALRRRAGVSPILTVLLPFGCGYYISYLYRSVNAVLSENLTEELSLGPADLGLLTSVYLIAFAFSQIPLGVALDRYGPRRMNGILFLIAAAGSAVFAFAESFTLLMVGRALIGLGVSAALMGAYKANSMWFPPDRLPLMNNLIAAFGALGAISATRPVEMLLHVAGWRDIFSGLAVLSVLVSLAILFVVPEREIDRRHGESFFTQIRSFREVFRRADLWKIGLLYAAAYTSLVSYQSLWADPWLRDIAGLGQADRANYLFLLQLGFLVGLIVIGVLADGLRRSRVRPVHVYGGGLLIFIALQVPLAAGITEALWATWFLFGVLASSAFLAYAVLTARFPMALTGRAITAMNFIVFVVAFICQWGIGGVIGLFEPAPGGGYSFTAHAAAFAIVIALQVATYVYFVWPGRGRNRDVPR